MLQFSLTKQLQSAEGPMTLQVSEKVEAGRFITLFGASGAGKTSILRMLAGLMAADQGFISVHGTTWLDTAHNISLPPQKRKLGFVFQDYALFPNMTVWENLVFGLEKGQSKGEVEELMELIALAGVRDRKPATLSGGQRQRVALARALVRKPSLLMLDEPLSALNREMRIKLQDYLIHLHKKFELTTLLVSHDISEIFKLSQEVWVLEKGKLTNKGTPYEIFSQRTLSGKFQFIGEIMDISKEDVIFVFTILIGQQLVKIVVDEREAAQFQVGEQILVASKAFNPVIQKIIPAQQKS